VLTNNSPVSEMTV